METQKTLKLDSQHSLAFDFSVDPDFPNEIRIYLDSNINGKIITKEIASIVQPYTYDFDIPKFEDALEVCVNPDGSSYARITIPFDEG